MNNYKFERGRQMKSKRGLVYCAALFYVLITGHSFLFTKIALNTADPLDILAHRFSAAFIAVLLPWALGLIKPNIDRASLKQILPLAILYPLLFFGLQTMGLVYATSSEGGIISAASPIFTLILATVFLKEKSTTWQRASIAASVAGVLYVALLKGASLDLANLLGIVLLFLSALALSGYNVLARTLTKRFTNLELSVVMITISFLSYNTMAVFKHVRAGNLANYFTPLSQPSFLIAVVYLGVLSSLLSPLLTNFMLSKLEASRAGVFTNLGTIVTVFAGVVFLQERLYYYHIIGSLLIIGGVIGANFLTSKKESFADTMQMERDVCK